MIVMIGDIARRLSMANPNLDNPLKGDGIVMIDEVDLHLHPSWQRLIVSKSLSSNIKSSKSRAYILGVEARPLEYLFGEN